MLLHLLQLTGSSGKCISMSRVSEEDTIPGFSKAEDTSSLTLQSDGLSLKECNPCPNGIAVCKRPTKNSNKEWFDPRFWARPKQGRYEHTIINSEDETKTKRFFYACPDQDVCLVTGCKQGQKAYFVNFVKKDMRCNMVNALTAPQPPTSST